MAQTLLLFPASIPSFFLGLVLLYWLANLLGLLDLDALVHFDLAQGWLGMSGVPSTISISMLVLLSWLMITPATHYWIAPLSTIWIQVGLGVVILLISFALSVWLTNRLLNPWKRHLSELNSYSQIHGEQLMGKVCTVTTLRVDEKFGQASYQDDNHDLVLSIIADTPNNLSKQSQVLIIDYHAEQHIYQVVAYP